MKFSGIRRASLVILILCGAALSTEGGYRQVQPLDPGQTVTGTAPGRRADNLCSPGETQYMVEFPGGARKLVIELEADQNVDIYVRRGSRVAVEGSDIVADFRTGGPLRIQRLTLPDIQARPPSGVGIPLLEAGTYFIAVANCATVAASYGLNVRFVDPPEAERVELVISSFEIGSVPAPEPGSCRLGRTQYTALASLSSCGGGLFWTVVIRADQEIKVYVRKDNPVAVENGVLVYDRVTQTPAQSHTIDISLDTAGSSLFFIAIESCGPGVANYTVAPFAGVIDIFPPFVTGVFFKKKDLHVVGSLFGEGAVVSLDGQPQETIYGEATSDSQQLLIVRKAKKRIARRQTVLITVNRGVCTSSPFLFTRR